MSFFEDFFSALNVEGVRYIVVGGMAVVLHGHPRMTADIDLIVDLSEPTFDHYMDLKFYLEALFERPVDLVLSDTIKPRLKPVIQKEAAYA